MHELIEAINHFEKIYIPHDSLTSYEVAKVYVYLLRESPVSGTLESIATKLNLVPYTVSLALHELENRHYIEINRDARQIKYNIIKNINGETHARD